MLFKAVPAQLGKVLPTFPPVTDQDIDNLMNLKMRM
jgi:hypothetical protein